GTRVGAVLFAHGAGGRATDTMGDAPLAQAMRGLGLALIAPQSAGRSWATPRSRNAAEGGGRGEYPYLEAVLADATRRFPIDRGRIMAAGFSAGAMLVWSVACERPEMFAGYLAFSGTLWAPLPQGCAGAPVMLRHIHGTADPVVPLNGLARPQFPLGSTPDAMVVMARSGEFGMPRQTRIGGLACTQAENPARYELSLCLFEGGHVYPAPQVAVAWRDLARLRGW
ncbi:alpha/beta hydrolase family esterase, partial [Falsiroseomonas oryzae]|uniref:alpha/beta hydrolase family esterase n=1 Tax=Falsiroseomonas oryzae TaxID=2766473 RepID=UPI0038CBF4A5